MSAVVLDSPPAADAPTRTLPTAALHKLGLSERKLDYWTRIGVLRPAGDSHPGHGRSRQWTPAEVQVARLVIQLRRLGFGLRAAARLARDPAARSAVAAELLAMPAHPDAAVVEAVAVDA
jgi:DNA-binding transcriptional MerR regulator